MTEPNREAAKVPHSAHLRSARRIMAKRYFQRHKLSRLLDIGFYPALVAGMTVIFLSAGDRSPASSLFMKLVRLPNGMNVIMAALCVPSRCLLAVMVLLAAPIPAKAQTIDAVYRATLAGIPIGKGHLTGGLGAGAYTVRLKGEASLLTFSSRFEASSNGASNGARIVPARYLLKTEGSATRTIEVNFAGDRAATVSIEPQFNAADREGRLPIELPHLKEVLDPMSAAMTEILRASQSDNPCDGIIHVFTGSTRFDLAMTPGDPVPGETVCRAVYRPIAGHKPSPSSRPVAMTIAYPKVAKAGEPRLPVRFEVPLPVGTIVIRRIS